MRERHPFRAAASAFAIRISRHGATANLRAASMSKRLQKISARPASWLRIKRISFYNPARNV